MGPGDWSRCYSATVQASAELVRCGLGQRSKITAHVLWWKHASQAVPASSRPWPLDQRVQPLDKAQQHTEAGGSTSSISVKDQW